MTDTERRLQANLAVNPEDGVLANPANKDNYFFPTFYASLCIDDFIGRGLMIDQKTSSSRISAADRLHRRCPKPIFQIRIPVRIPHGRPDAFFNLATLTASVIADYTLPIPLINIHLLANLGYERNMLVTSWQEGLYCKNKDFGVNRVRASLGGEATVFAVIKLGYEYTIVPNPNHNFSLSARF